MRRFVTAMLAGLILAGCGDSTTGYRRKTYVVLDRDNHNTIYLPDDQGAGPERRALPLIDSYTGSLTGVGEETYLFIAIEDGGEAYGFVQIGEVAGGPVFEGRVRSDRTLLVEGGGVRLEGSFQGAAHPLDDRVQFTSGVLFTGTWTLADGRTGPADAHSSNWPPGFHYVTQDRYDPLLDILFNLL